LEGKCLQDYAKYKGRHHRKRIKLLLNRVTGVQSEWAAGVAHSRQCQDEPHIHASFTGHWSKHMGHGRCGDVKWQRHRLTDLGRRPRFSQHTRDHEERITHHKRKNSTRCVSGDAAWLEQSCSSRAKQTKGTPATSRGTTHTKPKSTASWEKATGKCTQSKGNASRASAYSGPRKKVGRLQHHEWQREQSTVTGTRRRRRAQAFRKHRVAQQANFLHQEWLRHFFESDTRLRRVMACSASCCAVDEVTELTQHTCTLSLHVAGMLLASPTMHNAQ
jgi:hypothetical protein